MLNLTKPPVTARPEHKRAWEELKRACVDLSNHWLYCDLASDAADITKVLPSTIMAQDCRRGPQHDNVRWARWACWWMLRHVTDMSYPEIGKMVGRDHSTIINAVQRIEATPAWPTALELLKRYEARLLAAAPVDGQEEAA